MSEDFDPYRPNIREAFHNWNVYDGPFRKKLRLMLKNEWKKARTFKNCCGNLGEPGC